jgi:hypothetical protein
LGSPPAGPTSESAVAAAAAAETAAGHPSAAKNLEWTQSRKLLDIKLKTEQHASKQKTNPDYLTENDRLQQRLDRLGLDMIIAEADGNCQVSVARHGQVTRFLGHLKGL